MSSPPPPPPGAPASAPSDGVPQAEDSVSDGATRRARDGPRWRRPCRAAPHPRDGFAGWHDLPDEILQAVFDVLYAEPAGRRALVSCGQVCRGWYDLAREVLLRDTAVSGRGRRFPRAGEDADDADATRAPPRRAEADGDGASRGGGGGDDDDDDIDGPSRSVRASDGTARAARAMSDDTSGSGAESDAAFDGGGRGEGEGSRGGVGDDGEVDDTAANTRTENTYTRRRVEEEEVEGDPIPGVREEGVPPRPAPRVSGG